jgi:hypothetical protein
MKLQFLEFPDWTFEVDEQSAGVYKVVAVDSTGRRTELIGTDYDALLRDAQRVARESSRRPS